MGEEGKRSDTPCWGKSAPRRKEEASAPRKKKSARRRKKVEEGRERRSSTHGQATRSAARIEEEFNKRVKEENREALWKRCPRRGAIIRIGIVHKENNSNICRV